MRLDGKVVLITGASEGIGAACAREFGNSGAKLSLVARNEEGLARTARPGDLVTAGDLTTDEARRRAVDRTIEHFGTVDILINNAGIGTYAPSWEMPMDDARYLMELNFFVPLALTQLVAPHMRSRRSGMIVNVGSIGGKVVLPWMTLYSVTNSVSVTVGGASAQVFGAALSPGFVGLYQVAIQVPDSVPNGDQPVVVTIGGAPSPTGVVLAVQR